MDCNRNPWYILMTLAGEQDATDVDWPVAKENRRLWNKWACADMSTEKRRDIAALLGVLPADLDVASDEAGEIDILYRSAWGIRNPDDQPPPEMPGPGEIVSFEGVRFDRPFLAARMYIPGVVANGVHFGGDVTFFNCLFAGPVALAGARVEQVFDATGSVFTDTVDADRACFADACYWIGVKCQAAVSFNETQFQGQASFGGAEFQAGGTISAARFSEDADFSQLTTGDETSFTSTRFQAEANFWKAHFGDKTEFDHCVFSGAARFDHAQFGGETSFRAARFDFAAIFSFARFAAFADFFKAIFDTKSPEADKELSFANATFAAQASFECAEFPSRLPVLSGAALHGTTTLTASDSYWPPYGRAARVARQERALVPEAVTKVSAAKLRHVMGQQGFPEEEHFFFRREMHAAARAEPFWRTAHIYLFEALSNFGYSIMRPLGWISLVWAVGAWVYASQAAMGWGTGAAYSFATMFKFFGFQRTFLDTETKHLDAIPWMETFAAGQTVVGFILLFFLGLGLRTRFRLR